ncbi:AI-2E family transporter [Nakamurella aerolata]|uniref:AI-2E family transporter n=1 Tax=Nakamurella aerolata TaxID=1656892 RepID=A0A849AFQ7_9ACTN|nr:AI-2E family transporter [Nakamurella aerolata]NNG35662.1 AI-2E family transporter [Nakamurella aerolata]
MVLVEAAPPGVPRAINLAAAWGWRLLVIVAVAALAVVGLQTLSMIIVPLAVALLITALLKPVHDFLRDRAKFPGALATLTTVLGLVAVVAGLFTFAGAQIASGMSDMMNQARAGIDQIVDWLHTGPLKLSEEQLNSYIDKAQQAFSGDGGSSWVQRGTAWAGTAGHFLAGILIALFASFFFLSQGERIAVFLISLMPPAARQPTYQAGRRAWVSLSSYVRVQVIVAAIDAVGIGLGAAILRLPAWVAIALLVFVTSFIPIVGAIASGAVAVLVALVTHGLVSALVMLGVVLLVQQVESHVLQPFLMGKAVSLHPLAVLLAVVVGSSLYGIVGALFAVPVLAMVNSVVRYLHGYDPFPELGNGPLPKAGRPSRPTLAEGIEDRPRIGDPDRDPKRR